MSDMLSLTSSLTHVPKFDQMNDIDLLMYSGYTEIVNPYMYKIMKEEGSLAVNKSIRHTIVGHS